MQHMDEIITCADALFPEVKVPRTEYAIIITTEAKTSHGNCPKRHKGLVHCGDVVISLERVCLATWVQTRQCTQDTVIKRPVKSNEPF